MTPSPAGRHLPAVALALASLLAAGCGAMRHASSPTAETAVSEGDFKITMPATLRAGDVVLRVHNRGPERHELIAARVGPTGASALPLRADGITLAEEALQKAEVGELEPGAPGSVRTLELKLTPGHYVFFCNMSGHFLGGMHADVVVQ